MRGGTPGTLLPVLGMQIGDGDDDDDAGSVRGTKNGRFAALRELGGSSE
jgi:hypothetical protein